jgi:hypothetical protein
MKSNGGFKRQQGRRPDRPGRPTSNGPMTRAPAGPHARARPARQGATRTRGPIVCPMCGAVVPDLGAHVRSRHDDPASHPRD